MTAGRAKTSRDFLSILAGPAVPALPSSPFFGDHLGGIYSTAADAATKGSTQPKHRTSQKNEVRKIWVRIHSCHFSLFF